MCRNLHDLNGLARIKRVRIPIRCRAPKGRRRIRRHEPGPSSEPTLGRSRFLSYEIISDESPTMDVREYLTADGKNPYREWLDTLDIMPRARIQARVLRFSTGNLGDHKTVG